MASDKDINSESACRKDFAWKHAQIEANEKHFRCCYCNQRCTGTINRFKHHLAKTHQGMKPCPSVPPEAYEECKKTLGEIKYVKTQRNIALNEIRLAAEGDTRVISQVERMGCTPSQSRVRGPMDNFTTIQARQTTLNSKWKKEERKEVCKLIGRFFFSSGLAFNVINDPYFLPMCEGIGKYGPGFVPPTMHELRTWILKDEVQNINKMMEDHKKAWIQYGCSIMSDSWTDGKSRCLINFFVNSPAGTYFLKSIDASDSIKNGELLFTYLDNVVEEIGEENVVQVITDNGSNFVNAGKRLMEKQKYLYWTPCAAHCIDLMLEDIGKLKVHETTLGKAKQVVKFIYGHTLILSLMRSFTKDHELLRPVVIRFVTAYLTLQSIYAQKQALQSMFTLEAWNSCSWAKHVEGMKAKATVLFDPQFWPQLTYCIRSVVPLVYVLREVNLEEKPAMGFIYHLMKSAKEQIALNCGMNKQKYESILNKIEARWTPQLHQPLHATGYYLNPQLRFQDDFFDLDHIKQGLHECMDRLLDYNDRLKVDIQLDQYDFSREDFGSRVAVDSRKLRAPGLYEFFNMSL